ncbi:MAG: amidohydrolase family protein [Deltaproteobacteria bacterium]|nr:amidohydrolase family protein [Deltaproteobacteria bacterium]
MDIQGLIVVPGLVDIHLHLYDLLTCDVPVMEEAAVHGVTTGLSPGAANSLRAPSFLGSELDRGSLVNMGIYLGALGVLGLDAGPEEVIRFFRGEMPEETALQKISRSRFTLKTAPLAIGIKDHMAHFVLSEEKMRTIARIASGAGLLLMSHTQCPSYAREMVKWAEGNPLHMGHTDAAATSGEKAYETVLGLIQDNDNVTGELTTTLLRPSRGDRDGIVISEDARKLSFEALRSGTVDILISDGPSHSVKGFGDVKDSIPAIMELIEAGVLEPIDAFATMTTNPAKLMARITGNKWWIKELGSLSEGSRADIAVVNPLEKEVVYTFVRGQMVAFEGRVIKKGYGAGGWVTRFGILEQMGVGEVTRIKYAWK